MDKAAIGSSMRDTQEIGLLQAARENPSPSGGQLITRIHQACSDGEKAYGGDRQQRSRQYRVIYAKQSDIRDKGTCQQVLRQPGRRHGVMDIPGEQRDLTNGGIPPFVEPRGQCRGTTLAAEQNARTSSGGIPGRISSPSNLDERGGAGYRHHIASQEPSRLIPRLPLR